MRAALSLEPQQPLVVEDITLSDPGEGQVIVRLDASAVCSTDKLTLAGDRAAPIAVVPGHSATGVVEAVGHNTVKAQVGDRVVIAGSMECGSCYSCRQGTPSQCEKLWQDTFNPPHVGTTSHGLPLVGVGGVGTFSEYMTYYERNFAVVSSDLEPEHLALLGCGAISGVGAVIEVGQVKPGDDVLVLGCGHLGLWMIQAARMAGAANIIAVEPLPARRELAGTLGATTVIDPRNDDTAALVLAKTMGRGVDVALEATGAQGSVEDAFSLTRNGGIIVATSMVAPLQSSTVSLPSVPLSLFGKQVRGSQSGGGFLNRDLPRIARLIERGKLDVAAMLSTTFTLDQADEAMQAAADRSLITGVVLTHA
ncbi:zinc-binding alcohol dehydrogenase [Arthrobacter sp. CAU 1506]|uniref:zinc-binding dehydrogenase n=1 Tax=Arthrobacter sp. CAU 1506 TaxID=2560052 RepID=UPI0010AB7808|nr:zinc-binding dehydrogenase [Arthrobacter sp. CAU 1506]TJY66110.1 zinc-binding alcohol dehydrogenase [Arthrobacter sp. CAU 1506]